MFHDHARAGGLRRTRRPDETAWTYVGHFRSSRVIQLSRGIDEDRGIAGDLRRSRASSIAVIANLARQAELDRGDRRRSLAKQAELEHEALVEAVDRRLRVARVAIEAADRVRGHDIERRAADPEAIAGAGLGGRADH